MYLKHMNYKIKVIFYMFDTYNHTHAFYNRDPIWSLNRTHFLYSVKTELMSFYVHEI